MVSVRGVDIGRILQAATSESPVGAVEAVARELSDDATILCLDWHGTHDQERSVVAGADPDRASDPLV
jgi:hypothetical protein